MEELTTIAGVVSRASFQNDENGYAVFEFASGGELYAAVGVVGSLYCGEKVVLTGKWQIHPTYGRQFRVDDIKRETPKTAADMLSYLSSGIIKGVKEKTAEKIVERFAEDSFYIIEKKPERLSEISGISFEKAMKISREFKRGAAERESLISLEKYGANASEALAAFKRFGLAAVETIENNPYILCSPEIGVSFEKACGIASRLPVPPDDSLRTDAGIIWVTRHNLSNGHSCLPERKLVPVCEKFLNRPGNLVKASADRLVENKSLVREKLYGEDFIFLPEMYEAEKNAAKNLLFLKDFAPKCSADIEERIDRAEAAGGIKYNGKQRLAIRLAVERGILILTGGPGTGKTAALRGILDVFESRGIKTVLAAPTGRAAKRMSELTGREASTVHRLLEVEWNGGGSLTFKRNRRNPLNADAVIIDELSMVDVKLFSSLLDALPPGCRLVMVGDSNQLPPVGAGNVLKDMIESGVLPVVELDEVFRQAMKSLIIRNAHKILRGELPELFCRNGDFFFLERRLPKDAAETIVELCSERLPKAYDFLPIRDVQTLCPSRKGVVGTESLNESLQLRLNPPAKGKKEKAFGRRIFREGDKLMQIKNNYDVPWISSNGNGRGAFNGDLGILEKIDDRERTLKIRFDDRLAEYSFEQVLELEHAYAVTVHKSQGNEFEAVVMPVTGAADLLAYRNLLYTATTRAKKLMILVGSRETVERMVANDSKAKRYSALKGFIAEGVEN